MEQRAEIDRHADADKEQPQQQPLERLNIALQRVAVFRARQQHPGEERPIAIDSPAISSRMPKPNTRNSATALNTSRMPERATKCSSGRVT